MLTYYVAAHVLYLQTQKKEVARLNEVIVALRAELDNVRREAYEANNKVSYPVHFSSKFEHANREYL